MARKVDPEVLAGFLEEARGYLPRILQGIEAFQADPSDGDRLEEAYRLAHSMKGTALLVGLSGLSTMAQNLEEAFEGLMNGPKLPPIDDAALFLGHIIEQMSLYVDAKSNGNLREKPLVEAATEAYEQYRNLELHERTTPSTRAGAAAEHGTAPSLSERLVDLRGWLNEAAAGAPGDMAAVRQPFELLQAEAFRLGRSTTAEALQRLAIMTEVWESLAGESPDLAVELTAFCDRALEHLIQIAERGDAEHELAWIVDESDAAWGEYLALIDPGSLAAPARDETLSFEPPEPDDAQGSIDASALLRLLTGQGGAPAEQRAWTPPAEPAESPEESEAEEEISAELREIFGLEAQDHLRELHALLPALDEKPDHKELLQDIRRSAHTLKGSAAMVGFRAITQLAHRMEDLLDLMYEGSRPATPEVIRLLYASTDALEDMVAGKKGLPLHELYAQYDALLGPAQEETAVPAVSRRPAAAAAKAPARAPARRFEPAAEEAVAATARAGAAAEGEGRKPNQFVRFPIERLDELVKLFGELVITRTFLEQRMADLTRQVGELEHSSARLRQVSSKLETEYEASTLLSGGRSPLPGPLGHSNGNGHGHGYGLPPSLTSQTHGFDDLEFDRYTEFHLLTRSLAETTSDIQTVAGELGSLIGDFDSYLNRQARLSTEIEDKLMRSRMVPLAAIATRLHRTVRNVSNQQGKQVDLVLEGEGTELDKTVLEEMADPLLHILRNSVDHGIESSEVRQAIGKPERGQIRLRADYVGSQVVIQISDDGAGLDPQSLRATAIDRGFLSAADAAKMTEDELFSLVYLPGFSTAQQISEVSGRGVGLDIVRASVHRLKGSLSLESEVGKGTTFTIRLPMTMAVMRAILVKSHQETFAVPLGAVHQIVRMEGPELEYVGENPVVRIGDQLYPAYSLGKVLNLKQPADDSVQRRPVLLLDVGAKKVAIIVDRLIGGREIVIKNLGNHLRRVPNLIGATLMGDGSVVLILDPVEVVRSAVGSASKIPARSLPVAPVGPVRDTWTILVVDDSPSVRRVLSNRIKTAGWKAVTAKDGLEALEVLHHTTTVPDLILLDVEMPRMDGYELLATLRAHETYRQIPTVMVTSRAGDKHRRKALDLGASGYVVKPYQDEALLNVIRHLVRESRSRQVVHV